MGALLASDTASCFGYGHEPFLQDGSTTRYAAAVRARAGVTIRHGMRGRGCPKAGEQHLRHSAFGDGDATGSFPALDEGPPVPERRMEVRARRVGSGAARSRRVKRLLLSSLIEAKVCH